MRVEIIGDCTLYLADCKAVLDGINSVDAVVTDPPYGINEAAGKNITRGLLAKAKNYGNKDWDSKPPEDSLLKSIRFMSKYQIIFGGNYFVLPPSSCWLIWDKENNGDFADAEMAWTNLPKAVRLLRWRWNGMIRKGGDVREHPTQKPLGVMKWCISHLPNEVETILDPFMGSGTTGVACVKMGKKFIGIEQDEEYFEIACRRIREAYNQPDIFIEQEKILTEKQENFL